MALHRFPAASPVARGALWLFPLLFAPATEAIDLQSVALGVRYGEVINFSGNHLDAERADLFVIAGLPWEGGWGRDWNWDTGLELTLGTYSGDTNANVAALGPVIRVGKEGNRFGFEVGVQLTHLTESVLGDRNIGGQTHFTSHLTLLFNPFEHWLVGYRLQHISNAGIRDVNPGVNSQMLELRYQF